MQLDSDCVVRSYRMLLGVHMSESEGAVRAKILWSREELLAALIVRDRAFANDRALTETLCAVARSNYSAPQKSRRQRGDAILASEIADKTEHALSELLKSESRRSTEIENAYDAMQKHTLHWLDAITDPGFHWRIGKEARS